MADWLDEDARAKVMARYERLNKQVRVDGDFLIVNVAYDYEIPLSELDTHPKILGWVLQLCEKTWITSEVLERFILVAARQHGLEIQR